MPNGKWVLPLLPTAHRLPSLAWNAVSKPPDTAVIEGLVPASMPRAQFVPALLSLTVQRLPLLAWKAISNPPAARAVMEGLVAGFMARGVWVLAPLPTAHRPPL